ncbi:hypothetical protein pipiens_008454 [Culex pipiens pipiens]|uniref:Uncharacterized protein n=1 Tax=Culex pipiens pipiens TaxID=38569 RepID=A0ABD1DHE5_CULPP
MTKRVRTLCSVRCGDKATLTNTYSERSLPCVVGHKSISGCNEYRHNRSDIQQADFVGSRRFTKSCA